MRGGLQGDGDGDGAAVVWHGGWNGSGENSGGGTVKKQRIGKMS